jgi:hypothetical protein
MAGSALPGQLAVLVLCMQVQRAQKAEAPQTSTEHKYVALPGYHAIYNIRLPVAASWRRASRVYAVRSSPLPSSLSLPSPTPRLQKKSTWRVGWQMRRCQMPGVVAAASVATSCC